MAAEKHESPQVTGELKLDGFRGRQHASDAASFVKTVCTDRCWSLSIIGQTAHQIWTPKQIKEMPFRLRLRSAVCVYSAAGAKLSQSNYRQALAAKSLALYLQTLEAQKSKPAAVIEKKKVFIGAPNASTIEVRFQIERASGLKFKYIKNDNSSLGIEGIELNSGKDYYTNTREVICDGDLFIGGTLFLNSAVIATKTGCRIYATGPIFLQNGITYRNLAGSPDNTNLQLVSAEAILLGVGDKSCDPNSKESPLSRRLVSGYAISTFLTRNANSKSIAPKVFDQSIYDQGKRITALEDAGCRDDKVGFSRLLLDAPQVHSRYKGKFSGVVIAEIALFRLGNGNFEFDPVFKKVPVLPRLKDSDYLQVE
jgi:hypothetical protein